MRLHPLPTGQSILEVVLAATLIAVGLVAALSLATNSQKSADFSKSNNLATNYNYQAVDWLRDVRTREGWDNMIYYLSADSGGSSLTYCLNSSLPTDTAGFAALPADSNCSTGGTIPGTSFARQVSFDLSQLPSGKISGTVTTFWQEKVERENNLEFELTKW